MNISLLCKWWWKLEQNEGHWQEIVRKKYMKNDAISRLKKKSTNSPVWNQLLSVKDIYIQGRKMIVGKDNATSLWRDTWVCETPLKDKFPQLFQISNEPEITVAGAANVGWHMSFRRWLNEGLQTQFRQLRDLLSSFAINSDKDKPKWIWGNNGLFSVKSMYDQLCINEVGAQYNLIWKAKLPLKIKIWLWLIEHNAILTKDNLAKKNWSGDIHCLFCNEVETIDHLFFVCVSSKYTWSLVASVLGASHRPISFGQFWQWASVLLPNRKHFHIIGLAAICWALWTTRNDSCFEKKAIRSPTEIVCSASSFIKILGRFTDGTKQGGTRSRCGGPPEDGAALPHTGFWQWRGDSSSSVVLVICSGVSSFSESSGAFVPFLQ